MIGDTHDFFTFGFQKWEIMEERSNKYLDERTHSFVDSKGPPWWIPRIIRISSARRLAQAIYFVLLTFGGSRRLFAPKWRL